MVIPLLFKQILNNQWDEVLNRIYDYQRSIPALDEEVHGLFIDGEEEEYEESRQKLVLPFEQELTYVDVGGWTCLHLASSLQSAPSPVIRALCDVFPEARSMSDDEGGSTPLHVAVWDGCPNTVRELLAEPSTDISMRRIPINYKGNARQALFMVSMRDFSDRTPLDLLCSTHLGLLEEVVDMETTSRSESTNNITGQHDSDNIVNNPRDLEIQILSARTELVPVYLKARRIILASAKAKISQHILDNLDDKTLENPADAFDSNLLLHACVSLDGDQVCPLPLLKLVIKLFPHQLRLPDSATGNLPLHLAASYLPITTNSEDLCEQIHNVFECLITEYPEAAKIKNKQGYLPFQCAAKCERRWNQGSRQILEAYPEAIAQLDLCDTFFPTVLSFVGLHSNGLGTLYGILCTRPSLIIKASLN